jgi:hypothetical protein
MSALVAVNATSSFPKIPVEDQGITGLTLAVLGWVIYYLLVKIFPAQVKAQKEQRDAFLKLLKDLGVARDTEDKK